MSPGPEPVPLTPAQHVLWDLWIATFTPRRDGCVVDSRLTIAEPLDVQLCARAEKLGHALSGYLAVPWEGKGLHTTVAAIDVDTTLDDALSIQSTLRSHGINALLAESRRGGHLWVWPVGDGTHGSEKHMPVRVAKVRKALQAAVDLTITDAEARQHIEVFPKRSSAPNGVGALRMPLFKHPKTGIVYPVHDPFHEGVTSLDRQTVYEWTIPLDTSYDRFCALGGVSPTPVAYPTGLGRLRAPAVIVEGPGVVALLAQIGVSGTLAPGRNVRCPFHDDRHASLSIAKDDQRAWCKAPSCPAYNGGRGLGSLALAKLIGRRGS